MSSCGTKPTNFVGTRMGSPERLAVEQTLTDIIAFALARRYRMLRQF